MKLGEILNEAKQLTLAQRVNNVVNDVSKVSPEEVGLTDKQLKKYLLFRNRVATGNTQYDKQQLALQTAVWLQREVGSSNPEVVRKLVRNEKPEYTPMFIDQLSKRVKLKYYWKLPDSLLSGLPERLEKEFGRDNFSIEQASDGSLVVYVNRPETEQTKRADRVGKKKKALKILQQEYSKDNVFTDWSGATKAGYRTIMVALEKGQRDGNEERVRDVVNKLKKAIPEANVTYEIEEIRSDWRRYDYRPDSTIAEYFVVPIKIIITTP